MKKVAARYPVNLTNTFVVWAPKIFSVTPPPNAAPSPSLFGRCMRMTRIIRRATIIQTASNVVIRMDMGTGNMPKEGAEANRRTPGGTRVVVSGVARSGADDAAPSKSHHRSLIRFQIASNSARFASPNFLPLAFNSSSTRLKRATNLSVAF